MRIVFGPSGEHLRGWKPSDDFSCELVRSDESYGVAGAPISTTIKDLTFAGTQTVGTAQKSDLLISNASDNPVVTLESLTPAVCTVDALGHVSRVADGSCVIRATGQTGKRDIQQTIITSGGQPIYTSVTAIASGSLRKYLKDQQLAAISGVTPGSLSQRVHTTPYNAGFGATGNSVNVSNFIRAQTKTGFHPFHLDVLDELLVGGTGPAQWRAWISPHHFLTWLGHGSNSSPGNWVSIAGEVVVQYSATAWAGNLCKLLPSNWTDYIPREAFYIQGGSTPEFNIWSRFYNTYDVGADKRWVMPVRLGATSGNGDNNPYPTGDPRRAFQKTYSGSPPMVNGGDSGSPAFIGITEDGGITATLVPLGHTAYLGTTCSFFYGDMHAGINAAMNTLASANSDLLAGSYAVQTVDLSGFTSYA